MEVQEVPENKTEAKNQLLFGLITAATFLVLLYASIFKGIPMGINVEIFILGCYITMLSFFKQFREVVEETIFQTVVVLLLGITFMLYNNLILLTINGFLIVMIVGTQYRYMLKKQKDPMYSFGGIQDAFVVWFGYTFGGIKGAFGSFGKNKKISGLKGVIIGIVITVPLLAAVIALLMSADFAFSDAISNTFKNTNAGDMIGYTIAGVLMFMCASGLYYSLGVRKPKAIQGKEKIFHFNKIAVLLLAGCMDAVLAFFGVLQFAYLFSGNVPQGYTYARYAQNGFWQLVAVAVIVIAIVFIINKSSLKTDGGKAIKIMLSILCALTEILLISAFWRMVIYEQAYYFSILRIFTQAFMVASAGVFVMLIISFLRPSFQLKKAVFITGIVVYMGLNFMNADAFIAQQNCALGADKADIAYLTQLSADALLYYADKINTELKNHPTDQYDFDFYMFCRGLVNIKEGVVKSGGWQYFNVSRENAKAAISQYSSDFDAAKKYIDSVREINYD